MMLSENEFLIIEDHNIDLQIAKIKIQQKYPKVNFVKACNGQEAIELIQHRIDYGINLPGIILLDLYMPILNGYEFLDVFIKIFPKYLTKPKIVILTSSVNPLDKKLSVNYNIIDGFLIKPLDLNQLQDLID